MLDDDVWRYLPLGPLPTLLVAAIALMLLLYVALRDTPRSRRLAAVLLAVSVLALLALTLGGGDTTFGRSVSLRPGAGIRAELSNINQGLGIVNVLGNVVLFVPLGWLSTVLSERRARRAVVIATSAGFALSVVIELVQFATGRAADVDDVILNTLGTLLGAVAASALIALSRAAYHRGRA